MSHPQKNTLLQAAQSNAETTACKRVFSSPTQQNFFPSLPFLIILFSQRTGFVRNRTDIALNVNRCLDNFVLTLDNNGFRRRRRASANIGFAKWRLTCFYDSSVQGSSSVFQMNICAVNPPLRKAEKRY